MTMAQLQKAAKDDGIPREEYTGLKKQDLIFHILQGAGEAERPDVRRGHAGSAARRLRVPPQPGLQLPALPGRHLHLARRRSAGSACAPGPSSPARSARRRRTSGTSRCSASRRSTTHDPDLLTQKVGVRRPHAAAPERAAEAGDRPDRAEHAGHRPGHADRQGPARADRRPAAHRQDGAAAEDGQRDHPQPPGVLRHRAADRRAARRSDRHEPHGQGAAGRGRQLAPSTSRRSGTCRSARW